MTRFALFLFTISMALVGCAAKDEPAGKKAKKVKNGFVFRENLVTGTDTAMITVSNFKHNNIADELCQHWEVRSMDDLSSEDLLMDRKNGEPVYPELILFRDAAVLENPRTQLRMGTWQVVDSGNNKVLYLNFTNHQQQRYIIQQLRSSECMLEFTGNNGKVQHMRMLSDALLHQNGQNDPFHPINNQWRIKPLKKETDSAIHERAKQYLKFYALFLRDNIKRHQTTISFVGLPCCFKWYSGGLGLVREENLKSNWINCFYNKAQALQAYEELRRLLMDHDYNWPKNAPDWVCQTHAVLEQMYKKM